MEVRQDAIRVFWGRVLGITDDLGGAESNVTDDRGLADRPTPDYSVGAQASAYGPGAARRLLRNDRRRGGGFDIRRVGADADDPGARRAAPLMRDL
jgi:hypothetical protein